MKQNQTCVLSVARLEFQRLLPNAVGAGETYTLIPPGRDICSSIDTLPPPPHRTPPSKSASKYIGRTANTRGGAPESNTVCATSRPMRRPSAISLHHYRHRGCMYMRRKVRLNKPQQLQKRVPLRVLLKNTSALQLAGAWIVHLKDATTTALCRSRGISIEGPPRWSNMLAPHWITFPTEAVLAESSPSNF
ncbi:hypothetical protein F2P81_018479 [Scophthalmus maximus]|uniref:Uncharacterized protein n=1 Tax=Scophthalmus maximus TaxID=52904 RepID=A0A6A4SER9_SCOMX|nr:hypothetical protein F2P81_018479 [Scophthalmus maximus]